MSLELLLTNLASTFLPKVTKTSSDLLVREYWGHRIFLVCTCLFRDFFVERNLVTMLWIFPSSDIVPTGYFLQNLYGIFSMKNALQRHLKDNEPCWSSGAIELRGHRVAKRQFVLLFEAEDGGDVFPQNIHLLSAHPMTLYSRIQKSLQPRVWQPQIKYTISDSKISFTIT
jgi:hypothetical protein